MRRSPINFRPWRSAVPQLIAVFALAGCLVSVPVCGQDVEKKAAQSKPDELEKDEPTKKDDSKKDDSKRPGAAERKALSLKVRKLVRQLAADALEDRDAAEEELTKLGGVILDMLPPTDRNTPGEVATRLKRIANAIESSAANISGDPSRVSLSGQMRLDDAMNDLLAQTGNKSENASGEVVTTDFKNELYMKALDSMLDQASMNINTYGDKSGVLSLVERPEGEASRAEHATYAGAFRLEPLRVQAVRNLRNPAVQGCRVSLRIEWEPRLGPIAISQALEGLTVVDDLGNALTPEGQGNRGSEVQPGVSGIELELPLSLPDRKATKIASLKGKLNVLIPGRIETFQFDRRLDEAEGMELRKAGATVILDRVRKNGDLFQVMIRVRFDESREALESHRGWIFKNEAYMIDAKGQRVANAGLETTRQSAEEVGVAYLFPVKDLEGCRFVYRSPSMILQLPVEYELKDIPLP